MKVWTEFKRRGKPILATLKEDYKKEGEQSILLNGLTRLITQISGQNVDNMNRYIENMISLVTSIKDTFKKDEVQSSTVAPGRTTKLTKQAKAPSWSKEMSLETYTKQIATWSEINEDVPEYVKFHDVIEELKKNKDIKGLLRYLAEHILLVLTRKDKSNS